MYIEKFIVYDHIYEEWQVETKDMVVSAKPSYISEIKSFASEEDARKYYDSIKIDERAIRRYYRGL